MTNITIDTNKGRIEFLDNRFYSSQNGNFVPSVTTILDAYPKDASYFKWLKDVGSDADAIRDEAGRRGSVVHELTELYDNGEVVTLLGDTGRPKFKMLEWAMFERYVDWTLRYEPVVEMSEVHIVSDRLGFAGTLDRVINFNSKKILLDIKTSNSIYPSYWLQLSAYNELLEEGGVIVDQVAILWLNSKTRTDGKKGAVKGIGWQLITKDMKEVAEDWELFKSTFELWKSINKDVKPRNLSYNLKHKRA